jgi:hypothetical protein
MDFPYEWREPGNGFSWMQCGSQPMNAQRSFTGACLPILNSDRSMFTAVGEPLISRNMIETGKEDLN